MSRARPVLVPVLAVLALLPLLTGCGAGKGAQSVQTYAPADGVLADNGSIRALNALVVSAGGAADGQDGVISMTLDNHGRRDDRLTGLTSPAGTVDLTGSRDLSAGDAVRFGAGTNPSATIGGLTSRPGQTLMLRLTFARSESVTVRTVVVPASGYYAEITPGPATPAAESPSPSGSATGTESPTATPLGS